MEITERVRKIFQEMIVPELGRIREENQKIAAILEVTNKRLEDMNTHLADQSRRIDEVRSELGQRIDEVRSELTERMDDMHADLVRRIDSNNERIDQFFLTAATKEAQAGMDRRLTSLEREMGKIRQRLAA